MNGRPILHLPKRRPPDPTNANAGVAPGATHNTEQQTTKHITQPTRPRQGADLAAVLAPWTAALGVAPVDPTKRGSR